MKKRYWAIAVLVIVGGVAAFQMRKQEPPVEVTVAEATRSDVTSTVTATGKVFPEVEVRISSEVGGEIVELPVQDGQEVERGDVLVRVNPDTLEAQVLQQEAALRATQANSAEAQARMLQAELDLKRLKNLLEKGFATQDQVEEAETLLEIARASYEATLSRIEQQEMSLKERRDSLAKATTFSPIDGTITSLSAEIGDRVVGTGQFEGTEILRVANLDQMEVQVEVSEMDVVKVKVGDEASVEIEPLPDEEFEGYVTEIANSANRQQQNAQDQLTVFLVKVRLIEPDGRIRPGMTATADIRTGTAKDVVTVPLQSVTVRERKEVARQLGEGEDDEARAEAGPKQDGGEGRVAEKNRDNLERVVFVYENGMAKLRRVETGLADNRNIEIKSGIEAGEKIITGGYRVLTRELEHDKVVSLAKRGGDKKTG